MITCGMVEQSNQKCTELEGVLPHQLPLFCHKIVHLPNFGSELKEQFAFIQFSSFLSIVCFQLLSSLYHLVPPVLDGVAAVVTSIHQSVCHF